MRHDERELTLSKAFSILLIFSVCVIIKEYIIQYTFQSYHDLVYILYKTENCSHCVPLQNQLTDIPFLLLLLHSVVAEIMSLFIHSMLKRANEVPSFTENRIFPFIMMLIRYFCVPHAIHLNPIESHSYHMKIKVKLFTIDDDEKHKCIGMATLS